MSKYKYVFSATTSNNQLREALNSSLKKLGLNPSETNDTVTVRGEASFEVCMTIMARFLGYETHELHLTKGGE